MTTVHITPPTAPDQPKEEGPRGFGPFLSKLDDGTVYDDLGEQLQDLVQRMRSNAAGRKAKGKLTLVLDLSVDNDVFEVTADINVKAPKEKRPKTVLWPTKGNNLSPENPKQQKLPLREVAGGAGPVREVAAAAAEVRGA